MQFVDVEAGGVGLCVPQRDQAAAQIGIVDQVGAAQAQFDAGDRHGL
jgi:hypothetical protein